MTVTEAFAAFKSNLELPDKKQSKAAATQQEVREKIAAKAHFVIYDSFLAGSYPRHTKIDPLKDIDVFLLRNQSRTGVSTDGSGVQPNQALAQVEAAVLKAYPTAKTLPQSRSVNVEIPGVEFGFDLVPAWLRFPDGYWIPDTDNDSWLPTDPTAHAELMTEANKAVNGVLKPTIKMVKHWSRNNLDLLRSFHIELICKTVLTPERATSSYALNVTTVLAYLGDWIGKKMMDPIYGVSRVDKVLSYSDLQALELRVANDAQRALEALQQERRGYHGLAIESWKDVFIHSFPT